MFRYLRENELTDMKKHFKYYVRVKALSISKTTDKFFKLELSLDEAIKVYLRYLAVYCESRTYTDKVDLVMKQYLEREDDIVKVFLDTAIEDKYAHRYDNGCDYMDNYYDDYVDTVNFVYSFIQDMLPNKSCDIVDINELFYHFYNEELFNKERGDLWFETRKLKLEQIGGAVKARYWIPDRLKDAEIEDILPDESELMELLQTESNTIAIKDVVVPNIFEDLQLAFGDLLYCTEFGRMYSAGGLFSSFYVNNDSNFFLDLTSEDCTDLALGIFNIIAILMLKFKEGEQICQEISKK